MLMTVVNVGVMRVRMLLGRVLVRVAVRLAGRIIGAVGVLVMLVVTVGVLVALRLVAVYVFVPFGEVQPKTHAHQPGRHQQFDG